MTTCLTLSPLQSLPLGSNTPPASYEHALSFVLTPYDTGLGCEGEEVKPPPRWGSQICIEVAGHQQCVYS